MSIKLGRYKHEVISVKPSAFKWDGTEATVDVMYIHTQTGIVTITNVVLADLSDYLA